MEWGVGRKPLSGGCSGGRRPPVGTSRHHRAAEGGTISLQWLRAAPPACQWLPSSWQGAEGAAAAHFLALCPHLSAEGLGRCCGLVGLAAEAAQRV